MPPREWAGPDRELGRYVARETRGTLAAYAEQPNLVQEHANQEDELARGGYADRQLAELVQNSSDALAKVGGGKIEIALTETHLYCADEGEPLDRDGVIALAFSHLSPKRATDEIGRFGLGFKSVLGVSDAPEFFSRDVSFRFDPDSARRRILEVAPSTKRGGAFPTLRLPEPIDPRECGERHPFLIELMRWANNIVRLPLKDEARERLRDQVGGFPAEFLLLVDHVRSIDLLDGARGRKRSLSATKRDDECVLSDGGQESRWCVFKDEHSLSRDALNDRQPSDGPSQCEIRWAAPLGGRLDPGHFWAFFPTETASYIPGILNAPWKTHSDRLNLHSGLYNDELTRAAAALVAEHLPRLATTEDPAKHLDALPRRLESGDNQHGNRLRRELLAAVARKPVIPCQNGTLRKLGDVRYPPSAVTGKQSGQGALAKWEEFARRPENWAHHRALNRERSAKIGRLLKQSAPVPRLPVRRGGKWLVLDELERRQASIVQWLQALVKNQPGEERAAASMAAVRTAAMIPGRRQGGGGPTPDDYGRIVLMADDTLRAPDPKSVFLPRRDSNPEVVDASARLVHGTLAQDPETRWALRELGIKVATPGHIREANERRLAEKFTRGARNVLGSPNPTSASWVSFWTDARRVRTEVALDIIRKHPSPVPSARTLSGDWVPLHSVLFPGPIVHADNDEDHGVAVDLDWHAEDTELLRALGGVAEPQDHAILSTEPWFEGFRNECEERFRKAAFERTGSTPQAGYGVFESVIGSGPLEVLSRLSPAAAARYTDASLALDSTFPVWTMWHETRAEYYGSVEFTSPAIEMLRTHGWIATAEGPIRLNAALGLRPTSMEALHVLLNHPHADKIKDAFKLTEPDPVFTGKVDPIPLVDNWPGLRDHLRDEQLGINLVLCSGISVAGSERSCVLHEGDVYVSDDNEAKLVQLILVAHHLALPMDADELIRINERRTAREIEERRAVVRRQTSDSKRLLKAVGETGLRTVLGDVTLAILERERRARGAGGEGAALTPEKIADAVIATHHTDALRQCKAMLSRLDPPRQWAGSSAAKEFVKALGFGPEWAGQRGRRRESHIEVNGPFDLPPLHDYQEIIAQNVRELVRQESGDRRGLISLPTGAGKTRVAVQSLVEAMRGDELPGTVLWVADRDELCEQAVESWTQVWSAIGRPEALRVSRLWGGQPNPDSLDTPHVIVATVQTLTSRITGDGGKTDLLTDVDVVVFDEAHRSIAPTSTSVMRELGLTRWRSEVVLIGLTATPYRGYDESETARLVQRYGTHRLDHGAFNSTDPEDIVRQLQRDRILAKVDHREITGGAYTPSAQERETMATAPWLPRGAEKKLARDPGRTRRILRSCQEHIRGGRPALIFATSVRHAGVLAALLSAEGIRARAVSAKTEPTTRRRIVEEFRKGEIAALVNYGVFQEGFDAPRTRIIVVARPVFSPNVYFQMIGRGMRGEKNGGNDRCLVLNVRDNIRQFDRALAFTELDWLWAEG